MLSILELSDLLRSRGVLLEVMIDVSAVVVWLSDCLALACLV